MERKNVWTTYNEKDINELTEVTEKYKACLDVGKTERECTAHIISMAKEHGYIDLEQAIKDGKTLVTGDKLYASCMGKSVLLFRLGERPLEEGMNILGAHVDSPRIDIKQNPLYESEGLAYLDTHYYGGIKKYQWVTLPLAIHGVVVKKDGTKISVSIGEHPSDPVFCITDILIHLAWKQMGQKAHQIIEGENMDLLIGNMSLENPTEEEKKTIVLENIKRILKEQYDIEETDFASAELEIVPAGQARDCGLDRSMILAYGQDDRVCVFPSLFALLDVEHIEKTACCIYVDKEEIGSMGATGMLSHFFENMVAEIVALMGNESELTVRRALKNSRMLSCDVNVAYDPLYPDVCEKRSTAFFGKGMVFSKFTGSGGKCGSNDANAEYIAQLRRILEEQKIAYQFAEIGKVDMGGGGTIACFMANYGMEVIDSGVGVLSMHAPWEVTSKADIYEAYKGFKAFLELV